MIRNFSNTMTDKFYADYKRGVVKRGMVLTFVEHDDTTVHYKIILVIPRLGWCFGKPIKMYNDDLEEV